MQKEMRKERTGNPRIVYTSLSGGRKGGGGGGVDLLPNFQKGEKGGCLARPKFFQGVAGKERGDLYQGEF